jgi:hypothetical protein
MRDHGVVKEGPRLTVGSCSSRNGEKARIVCTTRITVQGLHVKSVRNREIALIEAAVASTCFHTHLTNTDGPDIAEISAM